MAAGISFASYAFYSTLLTSSVVLYAYALRYQFYHTVLHLVKSKFSILVLGNMSFVLTLLLGKLTNRVFLGALRNSEIELLWDNFGYAVTETCLALTIFRDELSLSTAALFAALLFFKTFHWLAAARAEHLATTDTPVRAAHLRLAALLLFLLLVDTLNAYISAGILYSDGRASVQLLFGFEYVLLGLSCVTTACKYALALIDTRLINGRWYNKSLYELYLRLIMDLLRLITYSLFFGIVFAWYGLPIHLLRQLYLSFKTVNDRIRHFISFRRVTRNLNASFLDATERDLSATDRVCIICREEMEATGIAGSGAALGAPKKLQCGHMFHFYCLRDWFERQLKCPTCRADVSVSSTNAEVRPGSPRRGPRPPDTPAPAAVIGNARNEANDDEEADDDDAVQERMRRVAARDMRRHRVRNDIQRSSNLAPPELNIEGDNIMNNNMNNNNNNNDSSRNNMNDSRTTRSNVNMQMPSLNVDTTLNANAGMSLLDENNNLVSVNEYLRAQIDLLSLQLQLYSAQMTAANATREAALATIRLQQQSNRPPATNPLPEHEDTWFENDHDDVLRAFDDAESRNSSSSSSSSSDTDDGRDVIHE